MHHPTDRIAHTTAFVTPVVDHWLEREIAQWVHPMKDQSDDSCTTKCKLYYNSKDNLNKFNYIVRHGNVKSFIHVYRVKLHDIHILKWGARCSSVVTAFANGAMGRWIDPSV